MNRSFWNVLQDTEDSLTCYFIERKKQKYMKNQWGMWRIKRTSSKNTSRTIRTADECKFIYAECSTTLLEMWQISRSCSLNAFLFEHYNVLISIFLKMTSMLKKTAIEEAVILMNVAFIQT